MYDCKSSVFSDGRVDYSHECLEKQVELKLQTIADLEEENAKLKQTVASVLKEPLDS